MKTEVTSLIKDCERCNNEFVCNANDITNCFCYSISLTEEAKKEMSEKYSNCLCENCLKFYSKKLNNI